MLISIKMSRNSGFFSGSDKLKTLFFLLINVKMPTVVGILTFMSRKKSCSAELNMENFITSGPGFRFLVPVSSISGFQFQEPVFCVL